jgi:hypothetical protein
MLYIIWRAKVIILSFQPPSAPFLKENKTPPFKQQKSQTQSQPSQPTSYINMAPLSLYDITIPSFIANLKVTSSLLGKAIAARSF